MQEYQDIQEELLPEDVRESGQGNPGTQSGCQNTGKAPQVGELCANCHIGRLDYDGLLNLACPACGTTVNSGGAFT